jgi:hypothetical protein
MNSVLFQCFVLSLLGYGIQGQYILTLLQWRLNLSQKEIYTAEAVPLHAMKVLEGRGYSSFTSALDGGEWSVSRSGLALTPGKGHSVPIVQEAG